MCVPHERVWSTAPLAQNLRPEATGFRVPPLPLMDSPEGCTSVICCLCRGMGRLCSPLSHGLGGGGKGINSRIYPRDHNITIVPKK